MPPTQRADSSSPRLPNSAGTISRPGAVLATGPLPRGSRKHGYAQKLTAEGCWRVLGFRGTRAHFLELLTREVREEAAEPSTVHGTHKQSRSALTAVC